jgi:hypothetical protein
MSPSEAVVHGGSIVGAIHDWYEASPRRKKPSTGWPTGSRLGTCAAQLQLLRFPLISKPEPFRARALRVFEQGDRIESWLAERLKQVYPGLVGFQQEPVFFSIPLTHDQREALMERITNRTLWGRVMEHFNEPKLYLGDDGRVKARTVPRDSNGKPVNYGFVLDLERNLLWVPTYLDFAVKHTKLGLTIVECKSMSNFAFRRAVLGHLDYGKRCQLTGFARATGANVILIAYRAETGHLAEIAYLRGEARTRVVLTKPNGGQDVYFVEHDADDKAPLTPEAGGPAQGFPADLVWEVAQTWTPYDPGLEAIIDQRVLDVLLFDGDVTKLRREAGPVFACSTCQGTGTQTRRKGQTALLKEPKPCEDCGQTGVITETELPAFPCGYCPVVEACWKDAQPRFEIDDKPHWYVDRAPFVASGLTFKIPEGSR